MTRLLLWSDTQFHNWQESEDPNRWVELVGVIGKVFRLAVKNKCHIVVFLGDLFESKRSIRGDIGSLVYAELIKWHTWAGIPSFFIAGNHDWYSVPHPTGDGEARTFCSLDPLAEVQGMEVIRTVPRRICKGVTAIPWGYTGDIRQSSRTQVFLLHTDIRGAKYSAARTEHCSDKTGINESILQKKDQLSLCINGHYHHPQRVLLGKGYVPVDCLGSPYAINWTDADDPNRRGIALLDVFNDSRKPKLTRIPLKYPRFWNSLGDHVRETDYVRDLKKEKIASANKTVVHDNYDIVGGADIEAAMRQYVEDLCDEEHVERLVKLGLQIYRGQ